MHYADAIWLTACNWLTVVVGLALRHLERLRQFNWFCRSRRLFGVYLGTKRLISFLKFKCDIATCGPANSMDLSQSHSLIWREYSSSIPNCRASISFLIFLSKSMSRSFRTFCLCLYLPCHLINNALISLSQCVFWFYYAFLLYFSLFI